MFHSSKNRCTDTNGRQRSEMLYVTAGEQMGQKSKSIKDKCVHTDCRHRNEMPYVKAVAHPGEKPDDGKASWRIFTVYNILHTAHRLRWSAWAQRLPASASPVLRWPGPPLRQRRQAPFLYAPFCAQHAKRGWSLWTTMSLISWLLTCARQHHHLPQSRKPRVLTFWSSF